ncbi:MAG: HlyD family efflux transporter periplasmic adaptor subunit [Methanobacteriota archaeon]
MADPEQTADIPKPGDPSSGVPSPERKNMVMKIRNHPWFWKGLVIVLIIIGAASVIVWNDIQSRIYVEDGTITAPVITISPGSSGILDRVYVIEGDLVRRNQILAKVDGEVLHAKTSGVITHIDDTPGMRVNAQSPVISMINREKLRAVGRVKEDKGLKDLHPGQRAQFTADAFPGILYSGTVEKITQTAREGDIVFSISDKRQEQEFEVTILFDVDAYPELKNGMSSKIWIFR